MNNEGGLVPTNLAEVMDKFNQSIRKFAIRETEWFVSKGNYENKIAELEGQVKAHENINIDLLKRIRMLEYALTQERIKNSKLVGNSQIENEEVKLNNILSNEIEDKRQLLREEDLKIIREKTIRPSLISMLNDIGINESLANSLFTDLELNKTELERLIKTNMDEKISQITNDTAKINENMNLSSKQNFKTPLAEVNQPCENEKNKVSTTQNLIKEVPKNLNNNILDKVVNEKEPSNYNLSLSNYIELKSHFDVVRKLGYLPKLNALVSISEDCLIKVWSLNGIDYSNNHTADIDPYLNLRGHTGPLFSLAVAPDESDIIYTAGNEGLIKIWKIPKQEDISLYGDSDLILNCNVGIFDNPDSSNHEVIWELRHHPKQNILVSLNADSFIYLWETSNAESYINSMNENKPDKWLKTKKSRASVDGLIESPIPTSCCFLNTESSQLICGFNDSYLSIYDLNKNTFTSPIKTQKIDKNDKTKLRNQHQPNTIISSNSVPFIYAGFEDNTIKTIDMRSESVTNSFSAHSDAVTSLNLFNDIYLFSTSHDTKIKMWDTRNLGTPVKEAFGSQKKWDEAMWHSLLLPNQMVLATAGADSIIKLFKL